jgi:Chalcone isomerase-like
VRRWLSLAPTTFLCASMMFMFNSLCHFAARAAQLDGVQLPDTLQVAGKTLHLNGYGLRTYSIVGVHIYAASLYVEHPSTTPEQIIRSLETKLLMVRFEHDVNTEQARNSWKTGLENNCVAPCHLDPEDVQRFLSQVPAMHSGDNFNLLFRQDGATVSVNGQQIGTITHRQFADAVLATFLGPNPASPALKQELLRGHP